MIDLKNKPEGATGFRNSHFYRKVDECWLVYIGGKWEVSRLHSGEMAKITPIVDWTIHNNTLPLSELSDERAAELFNYWRSGGVIEFKNGLTDWRLDTPEWLMGVVYRAKQKTERELFIEAAIPHIVHSGFLSSDGTMAKDVAEKMFDAGFKAPKDGE